MQDQMLRHFGMDKDPELDLDSEFEKESDWLYLPPGARGSAGTLTTSSNDKVPSITIPTEQMHGPHRSPQGLTSPRPTSPLQVFRTGIPSPASGRPNSPLSSGRLSASGTSAARPASPSRISGPSHSRTPSASSRAGLQPLRPARLLSPSPAPPGRFGSPTPDRIPASSPRNAFSPHSGSAAKPATSTVGPKRFQAPEGLFNPGLTGGNSSSIKARPSTSSSPLRRVGGTALASPRLPNRRHVGGKSSDYHTGTSSQPDVSNEAQSDSPSAPGSRSTSPSSKSQHQDGTAAGEGSEFMDPQASSESQWLYVMPPRDGKAALVPPSAEPSFRLQALSPKSGSRASDLTDGASSKIPMRKELARAQSPGSVAGQGTRLSSTMRPRTSVPSKGDPPRLVVRPSSPTQFRPGTGASSVASAIRTGARGSMSPSRFTKVTKDAQLELNQTSVAPSPSKASSMAGLRGRPSPPQNTRSVSPTSDCRTSAIVASSTKPQSGTLLPDFLQDLKEDRPPNLRTRPLEGHETGVMSAATLGSPTKRRRGSPTPVASGLAPGRTRAASPGRSTSPAKSAVASTLGRTSSSLSTGSSGRAPASSSVAFGSSVKTTNSRAATAGGISPSRGRTSSSSSAGRSSSSWSYHESASLSTFSASKLSTAKRNRSGEIEEQSSQDANERETSQGNSFEGSGTPSSITDHPVPVSLGEFQDRESLSRSQSDPQSSNGGESGPISVTSADLHGECEQGQPIEGRQGSSAISKEPDTESSVRGKEEAALKSKASHADAGSRGGKKTTSSRRVPFGPKETAMYYNLPSSSRFQAPPGVWQSPSSDGTGSLWGAGCSDGETEGGVSEGGAMGDAEAESEDTPESVEATTSESSQKKQVEPGAKEEAASSTSSKNTSASASDTGQEDSAIQEPTKLQTENHPEGCGSMSAERMNTSGPPPVQSLGILRKTVDPAANLDVSAEDAKSRAGNYRSIPHAAQPSSHSLLQSSVPLPPNRPDSISGKDVEISVEESLLYGDLVKPVKAQIDGWKREDSTLHDQLEKEVQKIQSPRPSSTSLDDKAPSPSPSISRARSADTMDQNLSRSESGEQTQRKKEGGASPSPSQSEDLVKSNSASGFDTEVCSSSAFWRSGAASPSSSSDTGSKSLSSTMSQQGKSILFPRSPQRLIQQQLLIQQQTQQLGLRTRSSTPGRSTRPGIPLGSNPMRLTSPGVADPTRRSVGNPAVNALLKSAGAAAVVAGQIPGLSNIPGIGNTVIGPLYYTADGQHLIPRSFMPDYLDWERSSSLADETYSDISTPSTRLSRNMTLEEATDAVVFCSSIVHDLVYRAATLAELTAAAQAAASDQTISSQLLAESLEQALQPVSKQPSGRLSTQVEEAHEGQPELRHQGTGNSRGMESPSHLTPLQHSNSTTAASEPHSDVVRLGAEEESTREASEDPNAVPGLEDIKAGKKKGLGTVTKFFKNMLGPRKAASRPNSRPSSPQRQGWFGAKPR